MITVFVQTCPCHVAGRPLSRTCQLENLPTIGECWFLTLVTSTRLQQLGESHNSWMHPLKWYLSLVVCDTFTFSYLVMLSRFFIWLHSECLHPTAGLFLSVSARRGFLATAHSNRKAHVPLWPFYWSPSHLPMHTEPNKNATAHQQLSSRAHILQKQKVVERRPATNGVRPSHLLWPWPFVWVNVTITVNDEGGFQGNWKVPPPQPLGVHVS